MINWSTLQYNNKTKKIEVELEGVLYFDSVNISIKDLAERYIDDDPEGDYSDWDLYHKLHQLIAKIISRDDVTIKQFKSTNLVFFEPDIGFLHQEVLEDMIVEYVGERQDVELAELALEEAEKDPSQILDARQVGKELGFDNDYVMLDGKKCYASQKIYVDPRTLFPDMSEEEASTWNQPNPNPDHTYHAEAKAYKRGDDVKASYNASLEPWDPQKTPIKLGT